METNEMADDTAAPTSVATVTYDPRPEVLRILDTTKKCSACGRNDHLRRSSKKCPYYVARAPKQKENDNGTIIAAPSRRSAEPSTTEISTDAEADKTTNPNNEPVINNPNSKTTETDNIDHDISKPNFIKINTGTNVDNVVYKPVVDVAHPDFKTFNTVFKVWKRP